MRAKKGTGTFSAPPLARGKVASPQGAPVSKQHLWLVIPSFVFASPGCRKDQRGKAVSPVGPLPAGSFARDWTAILDLKKDPGRSLHPLNELLFVYTGGNVSYGLGRSSGAIQFISD